MILLIGDGDDPHLIELQKKILENNFEAIILSTKRDDLLHTEFEFLSHRINTGQTTCHIRQAQQSIELKNIEIAFCLSPLCKRDDVTFFSQEAKFWYFSWKESLWGLYSLLSLQGKLLNGSIENCMSVQNKISLYPFADKIGLNIPKTLISNSKKSIEAFFDANKQVVLKTLHQLALKFESESAMLLTQIVSREEFLSYQQQGESPLFLQQFIKKLYDIRLIVIGTEVLSCKIDASKSPIGHVDWRVYDLANTPHYKISIPDTLKKDILTLMKAMCLDYACIDICVDSEGKYWLLDLNPFGRYLWIEYTAGIPITKCLSDFLCCKTELTLKT